MSEYRDFVERIRAERMITIERIDDELSEPSLPDELRMALNGARQQLASTLEFAEEELARIDTCH